MDTGFAQELDRHSACYNVFAKPCCSVTWVTPPSVQRTYTDSIWFVWFAIVCYSCFLCRSRSWCKSIFIEKRTIYISTQSHALTAYGLCQIHPGILQAHSCNQPTSLRPRSLAMAWCISPAHKLHSQNPGHPAANKTQESAAGNALPG